MMGAAGLGAAAFLAACGSKDATRPPPTERPAVPLLGQGGPGPERHGEGRQLVQLDRVHRRRPTTASRGPPSTPSRRRPASRSTTPRTTTTTTSSTPRCDPLLEGGQDTGRDVWCSTDWMVARLIRQGYVQKLDMANIPNAKNLNDSLKNVEFDPGRAHSLPWQSGFAGIGYNTKATGGKKVESVDAAAHRPRPQGQGDAPDRDAGHDGTHPARAGQGPRELHGRGLRLGPPR